MTLGLAAACADPLPEPPDLSPLIEAYESPQGVLDASHSDELGVAVILATELRDVLAGGDPVEETVAGPLQDAAGSPDAGAGEPDGSPFGLQGDGVATVRHICAGWPEHQERIPEVTGLLEAKVRFSEKGLDAVIWGVADRCAFTVEERRLRLDGELALAYVNGVLFTIDAGLEVDGETRFETGFDFRAGGDGFEHRRELGDGTHIVVLLDGDGVLLRAANGDFRCAGGVCKNGDGLEVPLPELEEVRR